MATDQLLTTDSPGPAARFTDSGAYSDGSDLAEIQQWLEERREAHRFRVHQVPFRELDDWQFDPTTGNLGHRSGRFFTIEGLHVRTDYGPVPEWYQPIINQPEIGMLGFLVKEIDGVLHCLVQAKMEPGNVNTIQLSPTVQATRSNYSRVHRGSATRYLEYFIEPHRGKVLVDVLQSEQGAWFLAKRNRNIIVEVDADEPVAMHEDFRWMTLGQLHEMLSHDNVVNMDARTVLSCIPFSRPTATPARRGRGEFLAALRRSMSAEEGSLHSMRDILSWFTQSKSRYEIHTRRVPLSQVVGWRRTETEIHHVDGKHFTIIGARVEASSREVASWSQPLLAPCGRGLVALLTKRLSGVLHLLMHARTEAGYLDLVELAPTVQCMPENYRDLPAAARPPFLDYVQQAPAERIWFDTVQSEEGGRFFQAECRYMILEVEDDFPVTTPADYRWLTVDQVTRLLAHSHYLNVQARSLIACLHSLW
jgi:oxidase EvaA